MTDNAEPPFNLALRVVKEVASQRSRIMAAVKGVNTGPEIVVRKIAYRCGYRYRLHRKDLPGKPDLTFPSRHKIIFVHGCFWHGHKCARGHRIPKANRAYWVEKITRNRRRDRLHLQSLTACGWRVLTIWECELKEDAILEQRLRDFLD